MFFFYLYRAWLWSNQFQMHYFWLGWIIWLVIKSLVGKSILVFFLFNLNFYITWYLQNVYLIWNTFFPRSTNVSSGSLFWSPFLKDITWYLQNVYLIWNTFFPRSTNVSSGSLFRSPFLKDLYRSSRWQEWGQTCNKNLSFIW